ncbi:hypothetical protein [uncultured Halopseudomonas sp.]|jgi:hypothetical protein|uniref:hypothetical protein n=1 Tax=uncultured Halopseudomonas sp. TaxID=2901193 RepID=UPI0030EDB0C6|tara:strand:- start:14838 stop:15152 length:315 start_codon:yes stop_codon:yes gene_type:complete
MRLDGFIPFTALPERSSRPVVPPANSEPARAGQTAQAAPVEPSRALSTRAVNPSSANAEYIPARRESLEPVYGRTNQAMASYQSTASMPVSDESEGIFGIDLFA